MAYINDLVSDHFTLANCIAGDAWQLTQELDLRLADAGNLLLMLRDGVLHPQGGNIVPDDLSTLIDCTLFHLGRLGCLVDHLDAVTRPGGRKTPQEAVQAAP